MSNGNTVPNGDVIHTGTSFCKVLCLHSITRMQSSRMRTVRCSGRLTCQERTPPQTTHPPSCHVHPLPCTPPAIHAPCHARPLPYMPPAMHTPCHTHPLTCMPPLPHTAPCHAPSCHTCPLCHTSPLPHTPPCKQND